MIQTLSVVLGALSVLFTPLAGPYRVVMFKFRTFGGVGTGLLTWLGIALGFPAFVAYQPPDGPESIRLSLYAWGALGILAYAHTAVKWCSNGPPPDPGGFNSWFGLLEPLFALGLIYKTGQLCGDGAGKFVMVGFVASMAQVGIARLRRWLDGLTSEDVRRVTVPLQEAAKRAQPVAREKLLQTSTLIHGGALAVAPYLVMAHGWLKKRFEKPPVDAAPGTYRPPTFWGRVWSFVVGHVIFSTITGNIGFGVIFSWIGTVLVLIASIFITIMGGKVEVPESTKETGRVVREKVEAATRRKEAELQERWERKRPEIEAEIEDKRAEIESKKRQAIVDYIFRR